MAISPMEFWPAIAYVLVLDRAAEGTSVGQDFGPHLLARSSVLRHLVRLPALVPDLYLGRSPVIGARVHGMGPYRIIPLERNWLSLLHQVLREAPFMCVISDAASLDDVTQLVASVVHPLLHVTTAPSAAVPELSALDRQGMLVYCARVVAYLRSQGAVYDTPLPQSPAIWTPRRVAIDSYPAVTSPNELALASLHIDVAATQLDAAELDEVSGLPSSDVDAPCVRGIVSSADAVCTARADALQELGHPTTVPAVELIVATSSAADFPRRARVVGEPVGEVLRALDLQQRYTWMFMPTRRFEQIRDHPDVRALFFMRSSELRQLNSLLGVLAAGYCAPVLYLTPRANRAVLRLPKLWQGVLRGVGGYAQVSRVVQRIGRQLTSSVAPELLASIDAARGGIKLVSDAPLELLPVRGLPLGLQVEASRLTLTPGNLLAQQILRTPVRPYNTAAFKKILVVRAYAADDPRKDLMEFGVTEWLQQAANRLEVIWQDVDSEEALAAALNDFDGEIMIFDGHGRHLLGRRRGALIVGGTDVDVWGVPGSMRVPPIVVLSACMTHAGGASQATVANAFLWRGATTVLATHTAIDARHAAHLIGRFLFWVADLIPQIGRRPGMMRWSHLMLGLLRTMYIEDVLRILRDHGHFRLSDRELGGLLQPSQVLTAGNAKWFDQALAAAGAATGLSVAALRALHVAEAYFTDTLQYVQLGRPENLLILGDMGQTAMRVAP